MPLPKMSTIEFFGQGEFEIVDSTARKMLSNLTGGEGDLFLDYETLHNLPKIESVPLIGDKTFKELGMEAISYSELRNILK